MKVISHIQNRPQKSKAEIDAISLFWSEKDIEMDESYESQGQLGQAIKSINDLGDFLHCYESRYSNLKNFNKLIQECDKMYGVYIDLDSGRDIQFTNYRPITKKVQKYIKDILKIIIPPIKVGNAEKPEH